MIWKSRRQTETWENLYSPALFKRMTSLVDTKPIPGEIHYPTYLPLIYHSLASSHVWNNLYKPSLQECSPRPGKQTCIPAYRSARPYLAVLNQSLWWDTKRYDALACNKHWAGNPASCSGSGSPRGSRYRSVSSMKNTLAGGIWYSTAGEGREQGLMEGNPQEGFWCSVAWQ